MNVRLSSRFEEAYAALPERARRKVEKAVHLLRENPRHPSLRLEKIDARRDIWSGRVDRGYRFTFEWVEGGILLRTVGTHEGAYRSP